jgi:CubicO group peptidase (beta-lactamase class C family)
LTTPTDLAHFAQMMLSCGTWGNRQILSADTVEAATSNQLPLLPHISDRDRVRQPWGLGWRLHRPTQTAYFGDLLSPSSYGHWGSTGTVLWIDPDRDAFAVLLTTQPQEPGGALLAELSNAVAASMPVATEP